MNGDVYVEASHAQIFKDRARSHHYLLSMDDLTCSPGNPGPLPWEVILNHLWQVEGINCHLREMEMTGLYYFLLLSCFRFHLISRHVSMAGRTLSGESYQVCFLLTHLARVLYSFRR